MKSQNTKEDGKASGLEIDVTKYTAHQHPGKFQGESPECEYYWEQMLNGDGENIYADYGTEDDYSDMEPGPATIFDVNAEESEAFNLPIGATYMILEDSQGFVYGSCHTDREAAEYAFRQWLGLSETRPAGGEDSK